MPVSTRRFTEIRFKVSEELQRHAWQELYDSIGTNDLELARATANIFSMFDPREVWQFLNFVLKLPPEKKREKRNSTLVACFTLGRVGESDPEKAIKALRSLLIDDHMLRSAVEASLSNLWVYDLRITQRELYSAWIVKSGDNEDLQRTAVLSTRFILGQEPQLVVPFLTKVAQIKDPKNAAAIEETRKLVDEFGIKLGKTQTRRGSAPLKKTKKRSNKSRTRQ
jgi:hypothetical protein